MTVVHPDDYQPEDVDDITVHIQFEPGDRPEAVVRVLFHPDTFALLENADSAGAPRLQIVVGALLVKAGVAALPPHLQPSIRPTVRALQRFVNVIFRVAHHKRASQ